MARLRSLEQAAAWIDEVGVALLFPSGDYVLPSLWEAVAGNPEVDWSIRDEEGKYVAFTPNMRKVWSWKDELPAGRLACVGLHVARTTSLVAPRLVASLYAATAEVNGAALVTWDNDLIQRAGALTPTAWLAANP